MVVIQLFYALPSTRMNFSPSTELTIMFAFLLDSDSNDYAQRCEIYSLESQIRLHYISPSNLRSLLLLSSLQLRDLCPHASKQGLIRPSPPRSRRDQSDRYFLNMVKPRAYC